MVWFFLCDRTDLLPASDKVGLRTVGGGGGGGWQQ
jgi:hypothetical protein